MNAAELEPDKIRGIIEALLMTAGQPITPGRLLGLLKGLNGKDVDGRTLTVNEARPREDGGKRERNW